MERPLSFHGVSRIGPMIRSVRSASLLESLNLLLRFALELCAVAAVAYWGLESSSSLAVGIALAVMGGSLVALIWGGFIAPKAPRRLDDPARVVLELVVFGLAALGVALAGSMLLAVVFPLAVLINVTLMFVLNQRGL